MFRRTRTISPQGDTAGLLASCAQRWGVSEEEAARWALRFGLERLGPLTASPESIVGAQGTDAQRLLNALMSDALTRGIRVLRIEWRDGTLAVDAPRAKEPYALSLPPTPESQSPEIEALVESIWATLCYRARLDFYVQPGRRRGHVTLRWNERERRVQFSLTVVDTRQRTALLYFPPEREEV